VKLDDSKLMDGAEEGADVAGTVASVRVSIRRSVDRSEVSLPHTRRARSSICLHFHGNRSSLPERVERIVPWPE
jgi:hypothetical protein